MGQNDRRRRARAGITFSKVYPSRATTSNQPVSSWRGLIKIANSAWKNGGPLPATIRLVIKHPFFSILFGIVAFFFTFTGGLSSAVEMIDPTVSIEEAPSLDTLALIKAPFRIKNEGSFPIYHVQMFYGKVVFHGGKQGTVSVSGTVKDAQPSIPEIESQGVATRQLPDGVFSFGSLPLSDADIEIIVTYRPSFWRQEKKQRFHFIARRGEDGFLHWYEEPVSREQQ